MMMTNNTLSAYIAGLVEEFDAIPEDRKQHCNSLSEHLSNLIDDVGYAQVIFICTHNFPRVMRVAASYGVSQLTKELSPCP